MKALTVCQPYAELIARGEKFIENRTRRFNFRGEIAIHAGRSREWLTDEHRAMFPFMSFGHVVAIANLYDCVSLEELAERYPELCDNKHVNGPYCLILNNVRRIKPWPAKGMLGLWEWPARPEWIEFTARQPGAGRAFERFALGRWE